MEKFDWKEALGFGIGLYLVWLLTMPFLGPMMGLSMSGISFSSIFTLNTLWTILYFSIGYVLVKWLLVKFKIAN